MWDEFKKFAMKGNVVDLAVGVIIGGAFGKIVTSLVNDMIMPIVGLFLGGVNFTGLQFTFGKAVIKYGSFLQNVVDFLIIAASVFFMVRFLSHFKKKEPPAPAADPLPSTEAQLLIQIRDLLKEQQQGRANG